MIEITFLGVTSYPNGIGILIKDASNLCLLIDCGPSIANYLKENNTNVSQISKVFISHMHVDHAGGLPVIFWGNIMERFQKKVSEKGTLEVIGLEASIAPIINYCKKAYPILWAENPMLSIKETMVRSSDQLEFIDFKMKFFNTSHTLPGLGVVLECQEKKIAFIGDSVITDEIESAVSGADLLIISLLSEEDDKESSNKFGFSSPIQAGQLAKKCNAKALALIHMESDMLKTKCKNQIDTVFGGTILIPNNNETISL